MKEMETSYEQRFNFTDNQVQNSWYTVRESRKRGRDQKTLISKTIITVQF